MCNYRYEVWDLKIAEDSDWEEGEVESFYGSSEDSKAKAWAFAKDYSQRHRGNKISVDFWDCGGPDGRQEFFQDGIHLPQKPSTGMRGKNGYTFSGQLYGRVVGQKERKHRKDLLEMMNLIESVLREHENGCTCDVCELFQNHIRDDKARIDAELAGYRLYTKEDAQELDQQMKTLQETSAAYKTWMQWMIDNYESLKVEGFAAEVKKDLEKVLENTSGE